MADMIDRSDRIATLQGAIPNALSVFAAVPKLAKLLVALFRDRRVPRYLKVLTAATVAYVAMPFDFLPDFIPVIGMMDEIIVILLVLLQYMRACPPAVFREHWDEVMGADFDIEANVRAAMAQLEPLVGERFAGLRDWMISISSKIGVRLRGAGEDVAGE